MEKSRLSDQPRYWAMVDGRVYWVFDRDRADKHVATVDRWTKCLVGTAAENYGHVPMWMWLEACGNAIDKS